MDRPDPASAVHPSQPEPDPDWLPGTPIVLDPPPGGAAAPVPVRRARRRWTAVTIAMFSGALICLGVIVGEWAAETAEADALIDGIERSERAMVVAMSAVAGSLEQEDAGDRGELSERTAADLSGAATAALQEITAASDEIMAVAIQPWHIDAVAARDAYLAHSRAWQEFLRNAQQEPSTWFLDDPAISSTWYAFTPRLEQVVPSPAILSLDARVRAILRDGEGAGGDGTTLQASVRASARFR